MMRSTIAIIMLILLTKIASAQWITVPQPPDSFQGIEIFYAGDDQIYTGTFNGRVFGSTDHADTWIQIADGLPEANYAMVTAMVIVGDWFIMSRFGLGELDLRNFRSRRDGDQWSTWEPLAYQADFFHSPAAIGETLFVVREGTRIVRTDDFGTSWLPVPAPGESSGWKIFAHEGRLFAAEQIINGGAIYRSDDLGATWTEIGAGLGSSAVTSEIFWQGRLLVGVNHGEFAGSVWSSSDFGDSWQEITTLPTGNPIQGLAIAQDGRLTIGAVGNIALPASIWLSADLIDWEDYTGDLPSNGRPVTSLVAHDGWFFKTGTSRTKYRAPQPAVAAVDENTPGVATLVLTAHPNPFNPLTTLSYSLPLEGDVTLRVTDVRGRVVRTLEVGRQPEGNHQVKWDGRDDAGRRLPSGTYLARLETADLTTVQKMELLK